MREIKFTTQFESTLSFDDKYFKEKYEEGIANNPAYIQKIGGEKKHFAICPQCNNPVAILGIYQKIDVAPHARHAKGINIEGVAKFNEFKYKNCPYHIKNADYIKEYVPIDEEPGRHELYKIAKEHFDKAIYLLQKTTGIYITLQMAEELAKNYADLRVYNYIDATVYNIPWYLTYGFPGFELHRLFIKKGTSLHKHVKSLGLITKASKIKGYVYVEDLKGYVLLATNYKYAVDKKGNLNEWLKFSIVLPRDDMEDVLLYKAVERFSIRVDSYYFGNLVNYKDWTPRKKMLEIASKYMNP